MPKPKPKPKVQAKSKPLPKSTTRSKSNTKPVATKGKEKPKAKGKVLPLKKEPVVAGKRTRNQASKGTEKDKSPEPTKKQKLSQSKERKVVTPIPPAKPTKAEAKKKTNEIKKEVKSVEPAKKEKNKGKAAKVPEPPKKEEPKKVEETKMVKVTKKYGAVVDSNCPLASKVHVLTSGSQTYDQTLNQSNLTQNNNKYYILQVLENDTNSNNFYFWTRWGRVGVPGQNALAGPMPKDKAIHLYEKKLSDKTCKGEYTKIEISYDEEEKEAVVVKQTSKQLKISGKVNLQKAMSFLDNRLQSLLNLIFDMKMMNLQMKEIGYDAKKMPLGKLAKSTVQQGYEVLNDLMNVFKNKPVKAELERLSSKFYSLIPHDFGFQKMSNFILDNEEKVKGKLDMLQSLSDMQVATKLLDQGTSPEENLIDANYRKLECKLVPVDPKSKEYKLISQFIEDSKGNYKIQLIDVFTVDRKGEKERFTEKVGNRILLWHGSGIGNFVGILSQGLRIAPPEAPASGYRFGKGIYFADMIEKSAGYCRAFNSEACALLGDVACGNFSLKYGSDHNANVLPKGTHSTLGVGNIGSPKENWDFIEKDLQIPVGKPQTTTGSKGWGHNEYIVYDVAQVRLRYMIRMKLG